MSTLLRHRETHCTLADKLAFLKRPGSYPDAPATVDAIETHLSWVFLTPTQVYKLKKPVCRSGVDYRTLAARLRNCRRELALNRRLAADVYLDVVPLRIERGELHLGGKGRPVEWLVHMRRLPEQRTLRRAIETGGVHAADLQGVIARLVAFFRDASPLPMRAEDYRMRVEHAIRRTHARLAHYRLPHDDLQHLLRALLRFAATHADALGQRSGRIIEGHGDLRPEHVYLLDPPLMIDCLEFSRDLRLLDPLEEIAFLAMECEYLGAPVAGAALLSAYADAMPDPFDPALADFHICRYACLRAALTLSHLDDGGDTDAERWYRRAHRYLAIAHRCAAAFSPAIAARRRGIERASDSSHASAAHNMRTG